MRFNEPVLMSTNDGCDLDRRQLTADLFEGGAIGFLVVGVCQHAGSSGIPELQGADASEQSRIWRTEAFTYIGENLDDQPRVMAARLGRLWSVFRPLQMS